MFCTYFSICITMLLMYIFGIWTLVFYYGKWTCDATARCEPWPSSALTNLSRWKHFRRRDPPQRSFQADLQFRNQRLLEIASHIFSWMEDSPRSARDSIRIPSPRSPKLYELYVFQWRWLLFILTFHHKDSIKSLWFQSACVSITSHTR